MTLLTMTEFKQQIPLEYNFQFTNCEDVTLMAVNPEICIMVTNKDIWCYSTNVNYKHIGKGSTVKEAINNFFKDTIHIANHFLKIVLDEDNEPEYINVLDCDGYCDGGLHIEHFERIKKLMLKAYKITALKAMDESYLLKVLTPDGTKKMMELY